MVKEMISDEAVEAAAQLIYRSSGRHRVMTYEEARANCHAEAQVLLEAAAPYMLAQGWDEGVAYVFEGGAEVFDENPHRSRA